MSLSEALLRTIQPRTRVWRGQALAVVCVCLATLFKLGLSSLLPDRGQVVFFFPAVVVSAVWGGGRSGLTALLLSLFVAWYAFIPPYFSFHIPSQPYAVLLAGYLVSGGLVVTLGAMLRTALLSARRAQARYKALVEAATTVSFRLDLEGRLAEPNPDFTAYTGLSWLQQRDGHWRQLIHEADRERLFASLGEAARTMKPVRNEFRHWHAPSNSFRWVAWQTAPILDDDGALVEWMGAFMDIHEQHLAQEMEADLLHELQHRVKNSLAVVRALFDQTARNSVTLDGFIDAYNGRLDALSGAHGLLTDKSWSLASLEEVAAMVLRPFMDAERPAIRIHGPAVQLKPVTTTNLALVFHELATNASKYGALSTADGTVDLSWTLDGGMILLDWVERGGPKVKPPTRTGFGSRLLGRAFAHERDGASRLELTEDGARYHGCWRAAGEPAPRIEAQRSDAA